MPTTSCRAYFVASARRHSAAGNGQGNDESCNDAPVSPGIQSDHHSAARTNDETSYPDYFFDLRPRDGGHMNAATLAEATHSIESKDAHDKDVGSYAFLGSLPNAPPAPPPSPPTSSSCDAPTGISEHDWAEFQQYVAQVAHADPDVVAFAQDVTPPLRNADAEEVMREAAHLLHGTRTSRGHGTVPLADTSSSPLPPPPPPTSLEDVAELEGDLEWEDAIAAEGGDADGGEDAPPGDREDAYRADFTGAASSVFGEDEVQDMNALAALKGRPIRLQNIADTVTPPLMIPDKDGNVAAKDTPPDADASLATQENADTTTGKESAVLSAYLDMPAVRHLSSSRYLAEQDRLYLGPRTAPTAQLRPSSSPLHSAAIPTASSCVMVVFSTNDLRVHDNHLLALASVRARHTSAASAKRQGGQVAPVVAVCVLDYRTFAQPSVVGGFFRQSPQRAQFLLDTVAALRARLETELQVPLLVRCGRPEEHVPRLAAELGATDVFVTTQYAPHERRVQALMLRRLRQGIWVAREAVPDPPHSTDRRGAAAAQDDEDPLVAVVQHRATEEHPYGNTSTSAKQLLGVTRELPVVHSLWQTTLVHLDDLPTPLAAMKEGERWYHDDVTVSTIRPTEPYDIATEKLRELPMSWQRAALLPSREEVEGRTPPSALRGRLPTLEELGYATEAASGTSFAFQEVVATQSSHPTAGEDAALARLQDWLADGGMTSLLRYGRDRRTNTKLYSQKLARVSPYIAVGALSPRKYYEVLRQHAHANLRDAFVQQQFREGLLRLSRRDYWHWMGLRFGDRLFYSYGPHPEQTDEVLNWRHDRKIVQRWCSALTGIPFADAAMRELVGTGFAAHEGRQALAWLLTRGYGQDWRLGAEWMERCSLDYDPFVCYGNFAYSCGLALDDFGEPMRNVHYLAHHHDQTGIYIKKWLPQLSKVPPVYIHRPHILTPRMQAMHGVYLGKNYPYPIKLWQGAQRTLSSVELTSYYSAGIPEGPGYAEALRHGNGVLSPEEFSAAVSPAYVRQRAWAGLLPASAFADAVEDTAAETPQVPLRVAERKRDGALHSTKHAASP